VSAVTDIPLVANIEAVVRRLKPLADQKAIKLVTSVSSGTLRFNLSDFEVVLYNLVHNAIKFTSQGGEIKVMWQAGTLTVADSGIGIPTDQLPLICDRFYKGDAARGAAGSGLGLALVKETLDRYGATLRVTSIVGTGSTFTVSFKS
jgi:signal transduction histidine kinase